MSSAYHDEEKYAATSVFTVSNELVQSKISQQISLGMHSRSGENC